ncbi:MAG: alanine racemase [Patescibacteria group bacterium]
MLSFFRKFQDTRAEYESLIEVRILSEHILHNLDVFAEAAPKLNIAPVLKSNAYGHGLVEVAKILEGDPRIAFLVVDSYYEARVLRTEGIETPIVVMGYTLTKNIAASPFRNVAFSVGSVTQLQELARENVRIPLHVKFDTGMHRQGIMSNELDEAFNLLTNNQQLCIEGICSHLSDADGKDSTFTNSQISIWNDVYARAQKMLPATKFFHLSATKGVRYVDSVQANVLRLGLGLYGIDPAGEMKDLKPALELRTRITSLRTIEKGEYVGYNKTFTAERETKVATIPVGYYEGVDRRLSNKGFVEVNGQICALIGRISMNMSCVDVTDVASVKEGDEVIVISTDSTKQNSAQKMAELCNTIPYEILVHVNPSLRRSVV